MGFYSELQIEILELAERGFTPQEITKVINQKYQPRLKSEMPLVTQDEVENVLEDFFSDVRYGS